MKKSKLITPAIALSTIGGTAGLAYAMLDNEEKVIKVPVATSKDLDIDVDADKINDLEQLKARQAHDRRMRVFGTNDVNDTTKCQIDLCKGASYGTIKLNVQEGLRKLFKEKWDMPEDRTEQTIERLNKAGGFPLNGKDGKINWDAVAKSNLEMLTADDED